jgi:UDPglucose 6-dehydrogenase
MPSSRDGYERFAGTASRPLPIAVIGGAGYVGSITAAGLAHLGHRVAAMDLNRERLAQLQQGTAPFREPGLEEVLRPALAAGYLTFTDALPAALDEARVVFVAVHTPRRNDGEADLSHIIDVATGLGRHLQRYTVIAVKSTVPVGSQATIRQILEQFGRREGADYDLVANPEFLREGHAVEDFFYPDRVIIGGSSSDAVALVRELFEPLGAPILETTIENAQMTKYAANAFLALRISFINEIANVCERVGADVGAVAHGLGFDRRIGPEYLRPGIGFSGPCLPKDLEGLIRVAEDAGYEPFFLKAILEKNDHQRRQIMAKVYEILGTSLYGRRIGVLGLTFKAGTDDIRNSFAPVIVEYLARRGAVITAYDPEVTPEAAIAGRFAASAYEAAEGADLLLLLTGWEEFGGLDFERIRGLMRSPNLVDGVNVLDPAQMRRLGFTYVSVGRP